MVTQRTVKPARHQPVYTTHTLRNAATFGSVAAASPAGAEQDLLETVHGFLPRIRALSAEFERQRRLPLELVQEMAGAGLFRMPVPRALGGLEAEPSLIMRVVEEVSRADGSAGWVLMIGNASVFSAYLSKQGGQEIFGTDPTVILGGSLNPRGKAVAVEGGYRVSGRWSFASGIEHCAWRLGTCIVTDAGGQPRCDERGMPEFRICCVPAADAEVIDTWSVGGLRGTGSHDFAMNDVFVPAHRTFTLGDPPQYPGPIYRFRGVVLFSMAAVPLGIARRAIDELVALAGGKVPVGATAPLRERASVQAQVARAEGLVRSARALLYQTLDEVWQLVLAGETVTTEQQALLRLAATHATSSAVEAVDLMYEAAGTTSLYTDSPLERAFRDVHAAAKHFAVQPATFELAGRVLLGLPPGGPLML